MHKILNTAVRVLGPQVPLALAMAIALLLVGLARGSGPLAWIVAQGFGLMVLVIPAVERGCRVAPLKVAQLPGYTAPLRPPTYWWVRTLVGLGAVLALIAAGLGAAWVALIVMLLGLAALTGISGLALQRIRGRAAERVAIRAAVERYAPRFAVYTGRRNDGSYQLQMWIPLLERLDIPYVVVVRHNEAIKSVRQVTTAPIVSCPNGGDLDSVVVDSLRTAFYVNMISNNTSFVLYRQITHVYLGHGDSDKELSTHPGHAMFDRIFVAGPAAIARYELAGLMMPHEKFVVVGRPQLAGVQQPTSAIVAKEAPRVLVAPTWRGYNENTTLSSLLSLHVVVDALIARGAAVVFRPHPFSWLGQVERSAIETIDRLLTVDRANHARQHLLASEGRRLTIAEAFNASDAMVSDIGSVLVDYFATAKPYAVVLPRGIALADARKRYPTTRAAYLLGLDDLDGPAADHVLRGALDELLVNDPLAEERSAVARQFLGDSPGADEPFLLAVRQVLDRS